MADNELVRFEMIPIVSRFLFPVDLDQVMVKISPISYVPLGGSQDDVRVVETGGVMVLPWKRAPGYRNAVALKAAGFEPGRLATDANGVTHRIASEVADKDDDTCWVLVEYAQGPQMKGMDPNELRLAEG
jgi:hypothetical protein